MYRYYQFLFIEIPFGVLSPYTAYEVLSDPEQRKLYDRLGLREYENQGNRGNAGGGSRHGGQQFNFKQFFANFDAGFEGMGSKFGGDFWGGFDEDFFSSGFPSHNRMHQHQRTAHNAHVKAHNHARVSVCLFVCLFE